jgi:hypothetical protein
MRPLDFYEVVEMLDSPRTRRLGVAGRLGVVVGLPPYLVPAAEDAEPPGEYVGDESYGVDIGDDGYSILRRDLRPIGRTADPHDSRKS